MKKPRPLDFELNENKIHEIEWKIKELSKRNRKLTKRVHGWLIAGFFLMFALLMFKDFEYHAPLIAFFPAIIFGISIAKFAVKYYTQSIHKPQFTKDLDYQNYLEYIRAKRDYENQYRGSKRARWGQLQKKDFETEVISLLRQAYDKVKLVHFNQEGGDGILLGNHTFVKCLSQKSPVSMKAIFPVEQILQHPQINRAIIISQSGFRKAYQQSAKLKAIQLWNINDLIDLERKCEH